MRKWTSGIAVMAVVLLGSLGVGAQTIYGPYNIGKDIVSSRYTDAVTAFVDNNGLITVGGSGDMGEVPRGGMVWHNPTSAYITALIIRDGVTSVGLRMFSNTNLKSVTIGNSVIHIEDYAFENNRSLTSLTIGNSVIHIGVAAFMGSTALTSVTFPNSVEFISFSAFSACTSLTSIVSLNTTPPLAEGRAFGGIDTTTTRLYVPTISIDAYRAAAEWGKFKNIHSISDLTSLSVSGYTLTPEFDPSIYVYSLTAPVPNDVSAVTVGAVPVYSDVSITGAGSQLLNVGDNTISVSVTAMGSTNTYTINVTRQRLIPAVPVTGITDVLDSIDVGATLSLANLGEVVPADATNTTINWRIVSAGTTSADIFGNTLIVPSSGTLYLGATISGGNADGTDFEQLFTITVAGATSVQVFNREVPATSGKDAAVITPSLVLSGEFTAGPNPVDRSSGEIKFFRQGSVISNARLAVYDASGNLVSRIRIRDGATDNPRRQVGSWDLKDRRGRPVPEGTYLVQGVIKASDGRREKVSVVLGIR